MFIALLAAVKFDVNNGSDIHCTFCQYYHVFFNMNPKLIE